MASSVFPFAAKAIPSLMADLPSVGFSARTSL